MCWVKKGGSGPLGSKMSYGNRRTRLVETLLLMYRSGGCSRGPKGSISPGLPRFSGRAG